MKICFFIEESKIRTRDDRFNIDVLLTIARFYLSDL